MPTLPLTKDTALNCKRIAGVKELYLIKTSGIATMVAGTTAHDITDITFANSGEGFGKIEFKRNECEVTENKELMNEVEVNFAIPNPSASARKQLQDIDDACEMIAVARLYDKDTLLVIGYDAKAGFEAFLHQETTESTSGRAKDDENLFSMTLRAEHQEYLRVLSEVDGETTVAGIVAELLAGTNV